VEVDLCGHATLASAHALWDWGVLDWSTPVRFHTRSGLLGAVQRDGAIELDFPATPAVAAEEPEGLLVALGVGPSPVYRSDFYALVEVGDPAVVRDLAPDLDGLRKVDARAVIVTAREPDSSDYDVVSRVFGPNVGIDEDPVTGSAHCVLATHWAERLGPDLLAYQASARGGVVRTRLDGDRVALGGQAVTVLRAELSV
jgi:predicted PhzF superfamily epimerase YddE/YHI9